MKSQWKRRNRSFQKRKKTQVEERTDVLAALNEQRNRQKIEESKTKDTNATQSEAIKTIPGFFYDTERKRYYPCGMMQDYDCPVANNEVSIPLSVSFKSIPLLLSQRKLEPTPFSIFPILFSKLPTTILEPTFSVKGLICLNDFLLVVGSSSVYLFKLVFSNFSISISAVPQHIPIEGEVTSITHSATEFIVLSNTPSSSYLTHLQYDLRSNQQSLTSFYRSAFSYQDSLVLCGKMLCVQQNQRTVYSCRLPSEGWCVTGNDKGVMIGCQRGEVVWYNWKKQIRVVCRMKTGIKECDHWGDQFAVCDLEGNFCLFLVCSYEDMVMTQICTEIHTALSLSCCEEGVILGCKQGRIAVDWNGVIVDQDNCQAISIIRYSSPILCGVSDSAVWVRPQRGYSIQQKAIYCVC